MATAAQAPTTPTPTDDPVQRWLARRSSCPQPDAETQRAATNRANSQHSTGPRTEAGKQRSSRNALRHGLSAQTAVLPNEDPETYQRHIQQFLDEYAPATPTETQLVHEIANTAWRLNRIPFLEAELLSAGLPSQAQRVRRAPPTRPGTVSRRTPFCASSLNAPSPQALIQQLATLGLHGSRLSRQFQKAVDQLRDIQEERHRLERRQLTEAAELLIRHQRKGLPWEPADFLPEQSGFVFSKEQIERHARKLILQNPAFYPAIARPLPSAPPEEQTKE